jgi:hypothetical protein
MVNYQHLIKIDTHIHDEGFDNDSIQETASNATPSDYEPYEEDDLQFFGNNDEI